MNHSLTSHRPFRRILFSAVAFALLGGTALAADYVILELGDRKLKKSEVETVWSTLFPQGQAPDFEKVDEQVKMNVLRGAASEYLLYDEALKAGIQENEASKKLIAEATRKIVVRQFIESKAKDLVSENDIKAAYDERVKKMRGKKEARARHILVESEEKAKEIAGKIAKGGDFEALAKEHSKDPGSKVQGGDLGYFTADQMVKEFSDAVFALKMNEVSAPVKSSFGWHIIKLVDVRDAKAPTLSDERESIRGELLEARLNDYVHKLIDQTNIQYYGADGSKKEFSKTPDKAK